MDKHALLVALKDLAIQLGRTPQRDEFVASIRNGKHLVDFHFGSYSSFVVAAGLEIQRKPKIDNSIFEVSLEKHLEDYKPRDLLPKAAWPRIAILGDIHEPFSHERTKSEFKLFCDAFEPEYIVQIGDAMDAYSHSKFPRSHNVFTPKEEETTARKNLEEMWKVLRQANPQAKLIQLCGNHDYRIMKRVLEHLPSIEHWAERYLKDLLTFDGVETVIDPRTEYMISNIAFIHGFKSGAGAHSDFLMQNVVGGHTHRGYTTFRSYRGQTLFELNVGFAADAESKGLTYTATKTTGWTLGFGAVDSFGPRFIPMC